MNLPPRDSPLGGLFSGGRLGVRWAIADGAAEGDFGAATLARRLGVGIRALQRRVAAEGITLRTLIEEARSSSARALLSDVRLSVDEVAALLGYADERAFRRAFKRLAGQSPAQYRREVT